MTMPTILAGGFCAVAILLHFASIGLVIARYRRLERATGSGERAEGVSTVRPLCGIENFSQATLTSTFDLDHPSYEILFCAAHGADPVLPLVRRLITDHPAVPARLLLGSDSISTNPRLNNVVKGWEAARHAHIIMADSNVFMPPDYIRRLLAAWDSSTGLVCSPPIGCAPPAFGQSSNAPSSIPIRPGGSASRIASAWASPKARPCSGAGTYWNAEAVSTRWRASLQKTQPRPSSWAGKDCGFGWELGPSVSLSAGARWRKSGSVRSAGLAFGAIRSSSFLQSRSLRVQSRRSWRRCSLRRQWTCPCL